MTYKIKVLRYELSVRLNRRRGRRAKSSISRIGEFINDAIRPLRDKRFTGQRFSRVLRFIFEIKKIRLLFGINLTAAAFFTGIIVPTASGTEITTQPEISTINPAITRLTTESSVRLPTNSLNLSQGYHLLHPGIDIPETIGTPVYPIMDGTVEKVSFDHLAYGNHIIINHGSGFRSLYGHFSKILVTAGQKVDKNTPVGLIGSTGRSTGPHLHLEVYDNGRRFNPLIILKLK